MRCESEITVNERGDLRLVLVPCQSDRLMSSARRRVSLDFPFPEKILMELYIYTSYLSRIKNVILNPPFGNFIAAHIILIIEINN